MAAMQERAREVQIPVIFANPINGTGAQIHSSAASDALPKMRDLLRAEAESRGVAPSEDYFEKAIGGMLKMMDQQHQAWLAAGDDSVGFVQEFELPSGIIITMAKPEMLMQMNATAQTMNPKVLQSGDPGMRFN